MNDPANSFKCLLNPKPVLASVSRRRFKDLRDFRILSGHGFVACVSELLRLHDAQKKSGLALIFEAIDKDCYANDPGSLFVGNIPVVNVLNCGDKPHDDDSPTKNNKLPCDSLSSKPASLLTVKSKKEESKSTSRKKNFCYNSLLTELVSVLWSDKNVTSTSDLPWDTRFSKPFCEECAKCTVCPEEGMQEQSSYLANRENFDLCSSTNSLPLSSDGQLVLSSQGSPPDFNFCSSGGSGYSEQTTIISHDRAGVGRSVKGTQSFWSRKPPSAVLNVYSQSKIEAGHHSKVLANKGAASSRAEENKKKSSNRIHYRYHPRVSVDERMANAESKP